MAEDDSKINWKIVGPGLVILGLFGTGWWLLSTADSNPANNQILTNDLSTPIASPTNDNLFTPYASTSVVPGAPVPSGCKDINIAQGRKNAYRAWLALNKPKVVTFHNVAGPDRTTNVQIIKVNKVSDLPHRTHEKDYLCVVPSPGENSSNGERFRLDKSVAVSTKNVRVFSRNG